MRFLRRSYHGQDVPLVQDLFPSIRIKVCASFVGDLNRNSNATPVHGRHYHAYPRVAYLALYRVLFVFEVENRGNFHCLNASAYSVAWVLDDGFCKRANDVDVIEGLIYEKSTRMSGGGSSDGCPRDVLEVAVARHWPVSAVAVWPHSGWLPLTASIVGLCWRLWGNDF